MQNLKQNALRGGVAKAAAQISTFTLRMGSMIILARLLSPGDFGLLAMSTSVVGVFNWFKDAGLSAAAVQRSTVSEDLLSTLFWINLAFGGLLGLICLGVAPLLVDFYSEPRLFWLTAALGFGFVIGGAGVQHAARLERQMRFGVLSAIDVASQFISVSVGILLAWCNYEYWALVAMQVSLQLSTTVGLWVTARWIPGLPVRNAGVRSMMHFGGTFMLNCVVSYATYNTEKILVGRCWGTETLGFYGRAYQLISIPVDNLRSIMESVVFSSISRIQGDPGKVRNYFLRSYAFLISIMLPIVLISILYAEELIVVFFGEKWISTVHIFRFLAPSTLAFALLNPWGWLLLAIGRNNRSLNIAMALAPVVILGYVLGLPYKAEGVALGYSTALALWVVPHIWWAKQGTAISFRDVVRVLAPPFVSIAICFVPNFYVKDLIVDYIPLFRIAIGTIITGLVYGFVLLFIFRQKSYYSGLLVIIRGK